MKAVRPVQLEIPFEWETPPRTSPAGRPSEFADIAGKLRRNPGKWRRIAVRHDAASASMLARNIRRGHPRVLHGMDVTVRRGFEVWACYCPHEGDRGAS